MVRPPLFASTRSHAVRHGKERCEGDTLRRTSLTDAEGFEVLHGSSTALCRRAVRRPQTSRALRRACIVDGNCEGGRNVDRPRPRLDETFDERGMWANLERHRSGKLRGARDDRSVDEPNAPANDHIANRERRLAGRRRVRTTRTNCNDGAGSHIGDVIRCTDGRPWQADSDRARRDLVKADASS